MKKLNELSLKELSILEGKLHADCVFFNNCSICPHQYDEGEYNCRFNEVTARKKNVEKVRE